MYLKKIGELRPRHIALSVIAVVLLLVPAVGSVYTNPPLAPPFKYFPYVFLGYFALGLAWFLMLRSRAPQVAPASPHALEEMPYPRMARFGGA